MAVPLSQDVRAALHAYDKHIAFFTKQARVMQTENQKFTKINADFAKETSGQDLAKLRKEAASYYASCRKVEKEAKDVFALLCKAQARCAEPLPIEFRSKLIEAGFTDNLIQERETNKQDIATALTTLCKTMDTVQKTITLRKRALAPSINTMNNSIDWELNPGLLNKASQLIYATVWPSKRNLDTAIEELENETAALEPTVSELESEEYDQSALFVDSDSKVKGPIDEIAFLKCLKAQAETFAKPKDIKAILSSMDKESTALSDESKESSAEAPPSSLETSTSSTEELTNLTKQREVPQTESPKEEEQKLVPLEKRAPLSYQAAAMKNGAAPRPEEARQQQPNPAPTRGPIKRPNNKRT